MKYTVPQRIAAVLLLSIFLLVIGCAKGTLSGSNGPGPNPSPTPTPSGTPGPNPTPTPAPGSHFVTVSWNASNSSGLQGYNVYRGTVSGGPYSRITVTPASGTQFNDSTVAAGQTYFYVVTAVGGNGIESVTSNEIKITVPTP